MRSREGDVVTCSRKAARRAGTLSNWMDDTAGEKPFRGDVPVVDLRVILGLCEDAITRMRFWDCAKMTTAHD